MQFPLSNHSKYVMVSSPRVPMQGVIINVCFWPLRISCLKDMRRNLDELSWNFQWKLFDLRHDHFHKDMSYCNNAPVNGPRHKLNKWFPVRVEWDGNLICSGNQRDDYDFSLQSSCEICFNRNHAVIPWMWCIPNKRVEL